MEYTQNNWSRRKFIFTMGGAGAFVLINPFSSWTFANNSEDEVAKIVARTFGIDTHNHIDVPLNLAELPGPKLDLMGEIKKSGLSGMVMTFAVDYQKLTREGEAYERFLNGLTAMDNVLESNAMKRALNLADLQAAKKSKKPIVIQSVEGGHFLEGKIERLEVAYKRGLRHLGLLHDNDASVPLGDVFTNPPKWGGLTTFGADVVKECERLGILVDLSHCDDNTINGALKIATKPVLVSHTGLNTRLGNNELMSKMMRPRLISEAQAKIVAEKGGVIGVWTHLAESPTEFAANIKAMVDIVGIDHVAIGTDTKMTPAYHSPNDNWGQNQAKPKSEGNVNTDNNRKQENKQHTEKTTNTNWENQKRGFYYSIVEALLKAGFNEKEIGKIGGGNYCRIFDEATKGH
ncbi:dipeptidase [Epilithonimonas lactis]|uniref:Peptidase M19 n=1 Tax=Epilithonimonas lactis TaxID=421072 RepID=A0A085BFY5_9FLAO|nr:membrane dipeptidase [Epilithonimonas lactis]KFC21380.1 peptidase M19 [Epilithonimonas lactis]SEP83344.1 Zn-dependent dipeptidase, dipeptidase homolog [Epilithonimonas lactis]